MQQQIIIKEAFDWTPVIVAVITAIIGPVVLYFIRKRKKK